MKISQRKHQVWRKALYASHQNTQAVMSPLVWPCVNHRCRLSRITGKRDEQHLLHMADTTKHLTQREPKVQACCLLSLFLGNTQTNGISICISLAPMITAFSALKGVFSQGTEYTASSGNRSLYLPEFTHISPITKDKQRKQWIDVTRKLQNPFTFHFFPWETTESESWTQGLSCFTLRAQV